MISFPVWWRRRFPDDVPLGWMLRAQHPQRWMRIHSLPSSKQYAESPAERAIVLRRQNMLARAVLGEGAPCWIIAARYQNDVTPHHGLASACTPVLRRLFSMQEPLWVNDEEPEKIDIWCASATWRSGSFDALLSAIAEEREWGVLFASERSSRIFAPYAGGVDVIARSTAERDGFKRRFKAWLSRRADGA